MARPDITMGDGEIAEFLAVPRNIIVTTLGPRGWPHVVPMWYTMRDGLVVFRSFTKSQKIVNLTRDPRLTLLAEEGLAYQELRGVMIRGEAELNADRAFVLSVYGDLAARYPMVGNRPTELGGEALEAAFGRFADKNTAVIVRPRHTVSWDHTKLDREY